MGKSKNDKKAPEARKTQELEKTKRISKGFYKPDPSDSK